MQCERSIIRPLLTGHAVGAAITEIPGESDVAGRGRQTNCPSARASVTAKWNVVTLLRGTGVVYPSFVAAVKDSNPGSAG
jgi:hypothetical protein